MKGWYRKRGNKGVKIEIEPGGLTSSVFLEKCGIVELVLPDWTKYINCRDNKLTELIIPDSVQYINCMDNNLTELIVPDDCKVHCDPNVMIITKTMYNRSKRLKNILK